MKAPKVQPFHFSGEPKIGMRTAVFCVVIEGDPTFEFTWLKDNKKIHENPNLIVKTIDDFTSSLTITNLGSEHNGNYTCRVSNSVGYDQQSDVLSMKGKIFCFLLHLYK